MKKFITLLMVIAAVSCTINSFSQDRKSKFEFSCFGVFCFHLANEDLAVAPDKGYTHYGWDYLRLAYHVNPDQFFGFWTCFKLGVSNVERGISEEWGDMPDAVNHQEIYVGTTLNPFKSYKMWFHTGIGINRLHIDGMEDMQTGGGPGITFTGNSIWNKYISNLQTPAGLITGYPEYKRVAAALNVGFNLRIWGVFAMYFDYTPVLASPIRHDFSAGMAFIFPRK